MKRKKKAWSTLVNWLILISLVIVVGRQLKELIFPPCTDVTGMVNMKTEELEKELDITLVRGSDKSKKINHYSEGTVSVDSYKGIGVVYIDGKHVGLHIDSRNYSMYGVKIGDAEISLDNKITYNYKEVFEVIDDIADGTSTATFYYNKKQGDCLVVICNDVSNRVVAMTYFNDLDRVTERLSGI